MAEFYLVRHGQASFGTDDYDRLSALGSQQSLWLGEYFLERGITFDRVIIGTMLRHRQTAEAILRGNGQHPQLQQLQQLQQHAGLNEYDFYALFNALGDEHAELKKLLAIDKRHFYKALKRVLQLWMEDKLPGFVPESWAAFCARIDVARAAIQACGAERVLVVSSGGPISMMATQVLQAPASSAIELNLQVRNTSFSHYYFNAQSLKLSSFNNIPHLDVPARIDSITYG